MLTEAVFSYGEDVLMGDYTPSGAAVEAGEVVVIGDTTGVCHNPIPDGELGALGMDGGVYDCIGDAVIAVGKQVYFVAASGKMSESAGAGANKPFGKSVTACGGDTQTFKVRHSSDV